MSVGHWVNTTRVVAPDAPHPCGVLGYCPYGQLVEEYPLHEKATEYAIKQGWYSKRAKVGWVRCDKNEPGASPDLNRACKEVNEPLACDTFGHNCPVHYQREDITEGARA